MKTIIFFPQINMKQNLLYKWAFALILAIVSFTSAFADTEVTSLDQLKAGISIKIYPYYKGGQASFALACGKDGSSLTSFSKACDGDEWTLEDAGTGCFYLKNELDCYWAYQDNSTNKALTCTIDKNSAVKVKITWDSKYNGVCFWNQKDGTGLNNLYNCNNLYNWYSSPSSYNSDTNTTFLVYLNLNSTEVSTEVDGIRYRLDTTDKTAEAYTNRKISGNIEIPEYVEHDNERFLVTSLNQNCFLDCSSLTSITLPNSITSLGDGCFENCSSLTSITLPNSITSLGDNCFKGCSSLTSITLPNSITSLAYHCFWKCSSLTSITLPSSITSLENYCFSECSSLTSITLPNGITSLGYGSFWGCSKLEGITLPSSITSLGNSCFKGCSSLTSITLPNGITSLGNNGFEGCCSLISIALPNNITSLSEECFKNCSSLTSINLPNNITSLGRGCFKGCTKISYIQIPSSFKTVGNDIFEGAMQEKAIVCQAQTPPAYEGTISNFIDSNIQLYVPSNVIDKYKNATPWNAAKCIQAIFTLPDEVSIVRQDSLKLKCVVNIAEYNLENPKWVSNNTAVASVKETTGVITTYKVGDAVITATATDGSGVSASTTVHVIPLFVSSLNITKELSLLQNNSQKLNVTLLPELADNKTLEWASDNEDVATVDQNGVVKGVNAGTANIIAKTTDGSNLSDTCKVTVNPIVIELSTKTINLQKDGTYTEQVVTITPDTYPNKTLNWKTLDASVATVASDGTITAVAPGVSTIRYSLQDDENVYADCKIIVYEKEVDNKEVVYVGGIYYILDNKNNTATVTSIYGGKNYSLDASQVAQVYSGTINIPETIVYDGKMYTVTAVGSYAFNCQNDLQSIYVPRTVTTVESNAAIKAENLNRVSVADQSQLVNIGSQAFQDCASLKRFTFEGSTTLMSSIDNAAFKNCKALETVKWMGESTIKSIGGSAFYGCSVLNNVELPNSVLSIGNSAFRYNSGLTEIHLSTSLNYIDEYAFGECGFSDITLPESLANIQAGAFINNEHLQKIALPEHLQGLGSAAFENNSALMSVTFRTNIETMTIGNNAFNLCPMLTKVYISSLKSFAQTNFNNAKANPANTSQHIYDAAGNEIINVVLPSGTKYVNNNAFNGCAYIESIEMPTTMDHLNDNIIMGCSALKDVYCYAETVPDFIGTEDPADMDDVFKQATLHVLNGKEAVYKADNWWGRFSNTEGCNAPVVVEKVTSIVLNQTEATLYVDDTMQLSATVAPTTAANKNVTWASSNDDVAMVTSDGFVLAVAEGEANITATAADGSGVTATCHIKVETKKAPVVTIVSIAFTESNVEIETGETKQLSVTYNPENATNKTLAWTSAKSAVATVDTEGNVTGVSEGKTIITAKTTDGSNKTINCIVTVTKATGIDGVSAEDMHIIVADRHLSVNGLADGEMLYIADIAGHTVYRGTNHEVDLPNCGVYIIKVKGQTVKLSVK